MGEVKSVKVDNWGVFFLQKLQNFFNKTDYCDLTLQFRDNSQLKVHRLVLSACTDYFNVLEQTCEIVDDALIMPNEFQADVVVPIVNFMYTGTLEFELKMYGKLLRTAKEMNMTVLLKLLEAHRRTMENVNRSQRPPSPKGIRRNRGPMQISPQRTTGLQHANRNASVQQQQQVRSGVSTTQRSPSSSLLRTNVSSGGQVSRSQYHSQYEQTTSGQTIIKQEQSTSPFEQLRKGYNNNKRPTNTSLLSPPAKKPNLEDVKEFAEQQRMRKQIAAEFGDDQEYEGIMDDDIHADDDDDELPQPQPSTSKQTEQSAQTTRVEHGGATIIFKQETPDQQPTIIVKDSSTTKLNHAKIIAEVLRQYPHLMKGQKNIKLKIMPNAQSTTGQKVVKKDTVEMTASNNSSPQKLSLGTQSTQRSVLTASNIKTTPAQTQTAHDPKLQLKEQTQQTAAAATNASASTTTQKRRIDSKTMHSLIALGAENTTGPWLCLRCGVNNRPISIPSYRGFRRHLINTHKETIDPALCEHCGWRSHDDRELHFHLQIDHAITSSVYSFPECQFCNELFLKYEQLNTHLESEHANSKQQCIYCNRFFAKEMQLYNHMKTQHKEQALEDGIIDDTDEEYFGSQDEEQSPSKKDSKVKILSDISLPIASPLVNTGIAKSKTEPSTIQELLQHASTNESEIKFVGPDGHEVHLTEEQRKEILAQLNQQEQGGVVMMLNEQEQEAADEQTAKVDSDNITDAKSAETEESLGDDEINEEADADASSMAEDYDDSQIYNELNSQSVVSEGKKSEAATLDESKESVENLEWAENLISEHERETNNANEEKSKNLNLSDKLKEITGDWTEDENEDDLENCEQKTEEETPKEDKIQDVKEDTISVQECESKQTVEKSEADVEDAVLEEEDDIDLALQDMHKETPTAEITAQEEIEATTKDSNNPTADNNETVEKTDVDQLNTATAIAIKKETQPEIKEEDDTDGADQEFIKESPKRKDKEATDDVHLETDSIRKSLIDDLIAEADNAKTVLDEGVTAIEETSVVSIEKEAAKEDVVADKVSEELKDDAVVKIDAQSEPVSTESKTESAISTEDANAEESTATESVEQKPTTSSENTSAEIVSGNSADKVKSIISEWAEEDDDVDDDDDKVKEEL